MPDIKYYAIIVAGGKGSRMQTEIPKQFLLLNGRPVMMHTLDAFHSSSFEPELILVLHRDYHGFWQKLCREHKFLVPHQLVIGGEERFDSVKAALEVIEDNAIVAVHDAVRPCIPIGVIDAAYKQAIVSGNAVTAVAPRDSVRERMGNASRGLNRQDVFLIQTPQVFKSKELKKAYQQEFRPEFTDDSSVVESAGIEIFLMEGDRRNLKITFPEDLLVAEAVLKQK